MGKPNAFKQAGTDRLPDGYTVTKTRDGQWQLMRDLGDGVWQAVYEYGTGARWQPIVRTHPRDLIATALRDVRALRRKGTGQER